jgi:hypothetical protein
LVLVSDYLVKNFNPHQNVRNPEEDDIMKLLTKRAMPEYFEG